MPERRSWLARLGEALRGTWNPPLYTRDPALAAYFGQPTAAGVQVNEQLALNASAVWAAVSCIAGDVASLPFIHYKRLAPRGKERLADSKLHKVLHDEFNPEMSAMQGRETMQEWVLLWGNAYAEIQRNDLGQVVALWPLEPWRVTPDRRAGAIVYHVGKADGGRDTVPAERIFHVRGLSGNGLVGYSVVAKARESLGLLLTTEQMGTKIFANGAKYSGFFQHPGPRALGEEAHRRLKESIRADPPGSIRILEEGMTWKEGSMPLKDAEFLATRRFQNEEVARWFGIPPHKIGDLERATFSNIEEQNIDYVVGCLRRWLVRWEHEVKRQLIPALERRQQFAEHLVDGLLRGNITSRYAAYAIGHNGGWLSGNDVREYENLNPIPGGDTYLVQGAMVPRDRLDDLVDAQVRPAPAPTQAGTTKTDEPSDRAVVEAVSGVSAAVQKIADDLAAEVARRQADQSALAEAVAALPHEIPAPPVIEPPAPPPPPDLAPVLERTAAVEAAIRAAHTDLTGRLASDAALRAWREATWREIAGRLARRELAQARKRAADPAEAATRIEAFYTRFPGDGLAELRPWLLRLTDSDVREAAVVDCLSRWAEDAVQACAAALANGGLGAVVRRWEIDREATLTRALMEAIGDGG